MAIGMSKAVWQKVGLGGVILFAPGGFILGAALLADHYRKRANKPAMQAPGR